MYDTTRHPDHPLDLLRAIDLTQALRATFSERWIGFECAERIRALGEPAPGSYAQFSELTRIAEERGRPSAEDMLKQLVGDHGAVFRTAREVFPIAECANDHSSADLLTRRMLVPSRHKPLLSDGYHPSASACAAF
jgi:hypothetical protein